MTQQPRKPRHQPRSRRFTRQGGLPYLAAQLPPDFGCASNVNAFIYSLTTEVIAGRVESRSATVLGYLTQLAIQTLPLLLIESPPEELPFKLITHVPRPDYSKVPDSKLHAPAPAEAQREMKSSVEGSRP